MTVSLSDCKNFVDKIEYLKSIFLTYGMRLINPEEEFNNTDSKLTFLILKGKFKGYIGARSHHSLLKSKHIEPKFKSLTTEEKVRYVKDRLAERGCKISNEENCNFNNLKNETFYVQFYEGSFSGLVAKFGGSNILRENFTIDFNDLVNDDKIKYVNNLRKDVIVLNSQLNSQYNTTVKFLILEGKFKGFTGEMNLQSFIQGNSITLRCLTEQSRREYYGKKMGDLGYKVIKYPKGAGNSEKIVLETPNGHIWETNFYAVLNGHSSPKENTISIGETQVYSILEQYGIKFNYQHTIFHNDMTWQYMDFFLEYDNKKICIEYNGQQHYIKKFNQTDEEFKRIVELDNKKALYCIKNNIKLIVIPYWYSFNEINIRISSELEIDYRKLEFKPMKRIKNDLEIVEFYKSHTLNQTMEKFNKPHQTIISISRRYGFKKCEEVGTTYKLKKQVVGIKEGKVFEFNSVKEAAEYVKGKGTSISRVCKGKLKSSRGYKWMYKEDYDQYIKQAK